eukprot:4645864-Prymnesium_polylepis.1
MPANCEAGAWVGLSVSASRDRAHAAGRAHCASVPCGASRAGWGPARRAGPRPAWTRRPSAARAQRTSRTASPA